MFAFALAVSLICLAVPVSVFVRMCLTARRVRAGIQTHMFAYPTRTPEVLITPEQGAVPTPPRTVTAPCHPAISRTDTR